MLGEQKRAARSHSPASCCLLLIYALRELGLRHPGLALLYATLLTAHAALIRVRTIASYGVSHRALFTTSTPYLFDAIHTYNEIRTIRVTWYWYSIPGMSGLARADRLFICCLQFKPVFTLNRSSTQHQQYPRSVSFLILHARDTKLCGHSERKTKR